MKLVGRVKFTNQGEYGLFTGKEFLNLSQLLSKNIEQEHRVTVDSKDKKLFDGKGIVKLDNDLGGNVYRFWVGDSCLDDVLFDLSDCNKKVTIQF